MSGQNYSVSSLHEFLDYVSDKGLIKHNTAQNWRNAASRIFGILEESEQSDVRNIDIDSICQRYANLKGKELTPSSLQTYRSRLKSAVSDFVKYTDAPMSYRPSISQRSARKKSEKEHVVSNSQDKIKKTQNESIQSNHVAQLTKSESTYPIPIPLREDLIVQVIGVPFDLTEVEAEKIARVIKALGVGKN
ncbi:site-specific integrase [Aliidiomarina haloalkalitolerans]|uniref:Uncharacterized protein n=1 Tax=Aliidiomarina haloalkalitolerans TaxID=859059 RepID=A0A432VUG8_9GAMM|nr:site-specific integrase [Aliidiomarina haloalkalitolerans]RUO20125.1 hypothetical protein CWE06_05705 [Aliidiomarina haloalkalitolerans]